MTNYDALFIGAGQAGPFLAAWMAANGQKVALIELFPSIPQCRSCYRPLLAI